MVLFSDLSDKFPNNVSYVVAKLSGNCYVPSIVTEFIKFLLIIL